MKVEKWSIVLEDTGREYQTVGDEMSATLGPFSPGTTVRFYIRAQFNGEWGKFGRMIMCKVD